MSSLTDDIAAPTPAGLNAEIRAASAPAEVEAADYGPDEERLVQQARAEALLRLARAI